MNDDQIEELEVLLSIYPDEYETVDGDDAIAASAGCKQFKLNLYPNPINSDDNHVGVSLHVTMPSEYPSIQPILSIDVLKGLNKKHVDELAVLADRIANENVGIASIFSISEGMKEWLRDNNNPGQDGSMYSEMLRRMNQKENDSKKKKEKAAIVAAADSELNGSELLVDPDEEERIRKRQAGLPVTEETFREWKAKFDAEMNEIALLKNKDVIKESVEKISGKQWFISNKDKVDEEALILEGENEDILEDLEGKLGDIDIDDDDDDDEDYIDEDDDDDDDDDADYDDEDD